MKNDFCVVFITAPSLKEGKKIGRGLLEEKRAACVNVVNNVESLYWWDGKIENGAEVLLIIKTRKTHIKGIESWVKSHHSYSVPEVIALPVVGGSPPYLRWLEENLA